MAISEIGFGCRLNSPTVPSPQMGSFLPAPAMVLTPCSEIERLEIGLEHLKDTSAVWSYCSDSLFLLVPSLGIPSTCQYLFLILHWVSEMEFEDTNFQISFSMAGNSRVDTRISESELDDYRYIYYRELQGISCAFDQAVSAYQNR